MADKNLKARIVNKNGTSAEWEKATSFVPKKGELILYTDLNKIKIGDGVTVVGNLPFSDDDKVSKAGDTMTGFLSFKCDTSPLYEGSLGGALFFGGDETGRDIAAIGGYSAGGKHNAIRLSAEDVFCDASLSMENFKILNLRDGNTPQDAVNYKQLSERVSKSGDTMSGDLKMADDSGTVKGSLSDTDDGVALSAENGACLKVGAKAVTVCDNAGGNAQIKNVRAPVDDTDAANKKYVDDAIPTAQIEELNSAVAKAEPFFVEFTNTGTIDDPQWSANKTFSEIKSAHDTGRLCYAQVEQKNVIVPLIGFTEYNAKKKAIFSTSVLFSSHLNTQALTITEDNLISIERFVSQSQITTTGLLKGDGDNITAAVAGTDYAAANHTHDTYTATEIDTMWNAVTIS